MSCSKYCDLLGSATCLATCLGQVLVFQHTQDRYLPCHTLMTGTYFATCSGQIPVFPHAQDRYMYCHMLRTGTGLATCSGQELVLPHAQDRYWSCHMLISGSVDITYIDTMPTIDSTFFKLFIDNVFDKKRQIHVNMHSVWYLFYEYLQRFLKCLPLAKQFDINCFFINSTQIEILEQLIS